MIDPIIEILFEDANLLVVHKPAGVAAQSEKNGQKDLVHLLHDSHPNLFVVHRIDQRVSGLLILAKTKEVAKELSLLIQENKIQKKYRAVVKVKPEAAAAELEHYLVHNVKIGKSYVSDAGKPNAQKALLKYQITAESANYTLLEIEIATGRFHQIRCQLAAVGSPILGDLKYGFSRSSPDGSIFLQAFFLAFSHPITQEELSFELPLPVIWSKYGFGS